MTSGGSATILSMHDHREVARYAAECAQKVREIFENAHPGDTRPRDAIDAAWAFARGGKRGKTLRDTAWAAQKTAQDASTAAASDVAKAAMCAASAAYLHPLTDAHQVKHILGAAAYAARATELMAGGDRDVGADHIREAALHATQIVIDVLIRVPLNSVTPEKAPGVPPYRKTRTFPAPVGRIDPENRTESIGIRMRGKRAVHPMKSDPLTARR